MKKISFMLLCAASLMLFSCEPNGGSPTTPTTPDEPLTEADFGIKFYVNDSLLQYVNYAIVDSADLSLDCSNISIAPMDLSTIDSLIWNQITPTNREYVPASTIKVITLNTHLKAGSEHKFYLVLTRNSEPVHSAKINVLTGKMYHCISSSKIAIQSQAAFLKGYQTEQLDFLLSGFSRTLYLKVSF